MGSGGDNNKLLAFYPKLTAKLGINFRIYGESMLKICKPQL